MSYLKYLSCQKAKKILRSNGIEVVLDYLLNIGKVRILSVIELILRVAVELKDKT